MTTVIIFFAALMCVIWFAIELVARLAAGICRGLYMFVMMILPVGGIWFAALLALLFITGTDWSEVTAAVIMEWIGALVLLIIIVFIPMVIFGGIISGLLALAVNVVSMVAGVLLWVINEVIIFSEERFSRNLGKILDKTCNVKG